MRDLEGYGFISSLQTPTEAPSPLKVQRNIFNLHSIKNFYFIDTYLIHYCLTDVDDTEQDGMETEENIIGVDRVDSIRVSLKKLLLKGKSTAA